MEKSMRARAGGLSFLIQRWVLPFKRTIGTWAFVFNRWSGVLLTIYLYAHLGVLTTLAVNPASYDRFLMIAKSPVGLLFDVVLTLLILYHGLNGLRIIYAALVGKIEQQRAQFWVVTGLVLALTAYSAYLIFTLG